MEAPQSQEFVDTPTANNTPSSTLLANGPGFIDIIAYDLNHAVLPCTPYKLQA